MYDVIKLSRYYVITKNGIIATDKEVGQQNSFNYESEAWEAVEAL